MLYLLLFVHQTRAEDSGDTGAHANHVLGMHTPEVQHPCIQPSFQRHTHTPSPLNPIAIPHLWAVPVHVLRTGRPRPPFILARPHVQGREQMREGIGCLTPPHLASRCGAGRSGLLQYRTVKFYSIWLIILTMFYFFCAPRISARRRPPPGGGAGRGASG